MKRVKLPDMTVVELVQRFADIALEQDRAELAEEREQYAPLFRLMEAVEEELKQREGDQRRALLSLYTHPNVQVRLKAAESTLAIARSAAEQALREIRNSKSYPQAGEAGMTLFNLQEGVFKPK